MASLIPAGQPPQFPITPFLQMIARLGKKNPKFFNWLSMNSFYFSVITGGLPWVIYFVLPYLGVAVPAWLDMSNKLVAVIYTTLGGAGIGSIFAANTALDQAAPPVVTSEFDQKVAEEVQRQLKAIQEKPTSAL